MFKFSNVSAARAAASALIAAAVISPFSATSSAQAEVVSSKVPCAHHDKIRQFLVQKYSEKRQALGLINRTRVMEIYVSAKGSWTVVVTQNTGKSCIMATGKNWESIQVAADKGV